MLCLSWDAQYHMEEHHYALAASRAASVRLPCPQSTTPNFGKAKMAHGEGHVTTLTPAFIGAAAALAVMVLERAWVAWYERKRWERTDKRQVYARFWGAWFSLASMSRTKPFELAKEELGLAFGELQLVAPPTVVTAADALVNRLLSTEPAHQSVEASELKQRFIDAARRDLSY